MPDKIDECVEKINQYIGYDNNNRKHIETIDFEGAAIYGSCYITTVTLFACAIDDVGLIDQTIYEELRWNNARHMSQAYNN